MNIVVCGPRDYHNKDFVFGALLGVIAMIPDDDVRIVDGGYRGVDELARAFSREVLKRSPRTFKAYWNKYGKSAGPIRNKQMAQVADLCVAFQPKGKETRGTQDMIEKAIEAGIPVKIIYYEEEQ